MEERQKLKPVLNLAGVDLAQLSLNYQEFLRIGGLPESEQGPAIRKLLEKADQQYLDSQQ